MVSTIDDFERETRSWLRQCMQVLSGYPDVDTIGVKGWTTETRPTVNPNNNYLLGYNTDTNSLELINANGQTIEVLSNDTKKSIALMAHPVGSYYWTSDSSFNPANEWGGTWERIQDGRVLISNNPSHEVGSTGGAETVTLNTQQMPSHEHQHSHPHVHDKGSMNITGQFGVDDRGTWAGVNGAFSVGSAHGACGSDGDGAGYVINFNAKNAWSGTTSRDATVAGGWQGGGQPHNNMQPYRTAVLWHRTA